MLRTILLVSAGLLITLSSVPVVADTPGVVLATVNGKEITQEDYNTFLGIPVEMKQMPYRPAVINQLVNRELVVQEAYQRGFDKDSTFLKILSTLKYNAMFNFGMQKYLGRHPVSEERLRKEYERYGPLNQYQLLHIVVNSRREAEGLIEKIRAGGSFTQLAAQYSIDAVTRPRGGRLGWLTEEQMFVPIAKAVASLSEGAVTHTPVKTSAGWHVVMLEEMRVQPPLPFEAAKGQLMLKVRQDQTAEYFDHLRKNAKIEIIE